MVAAGAYAKRQEGRPGRQEIVKSLLLTRLSPCPARRKLCPDELASVDLTDPHAVARPRGGRRRRRTGADDAACPGPAPSRSGQRGIPAAILSFVGLNYFFTEPFHTLKVRQAEDLVALAVFLVVASVVAALVARVLQERDRAERSTAEARSLASFTGRLLSNEPIERSLEAAARTLVQLFDLSSCRIAAEVAGDRYDVDARGNGGAGGDGDGPAVEVPLAVMDASGVRRSCVIDENSAARRSLASASKRAALISAS